MTEAIDYEAADRKAREAIRSSLDQTLFVEAGAGTGKTTALVDRVVALVLGGKAIERIVAITFTERAAAELRDRIRAGLEAARDRGRENAVAIDQALASLDRAQISTIHSFCQALLYSFAAEAGIDPSFLVQDEVMAERRFHERWRLYLESLGHDEDVCRTIDRALGLGLSTLQMETLAQELTRRPDLTGRLARGPLTAEPVVWPDLDQVAARLEGLQVHTAPPDDKLRVRIERLASLVSELRRSAIDRESALAAGSEVLKTTGWTISNQDVWGGELIALVREAGCQTAEVLIETLHACRSEALAGVLPSIVRFVENDAGERGREGKLTFDDLILLTRDLLTGNPEAVRTLRRRYDVLLIDEFQDTDPLQVDIAMAFATNPGTGTIEPGRLFLVGDPKQSIYRFRRADMAIYSQTRERIEKSGGMFPALALNRRSRGVVLEWVNNVFKSLIGPGWELDVQPPYRDIHPARADVQVNGPGVGWLGGDTGDLNARQVRVIEAGAIVANCLAAVREGWEVVEPDGSRRSALLSDIAVLIPTRAVLPALERAFGEAEVPYRVESGSLIYRTQDVRDLLNCLTATDDPADEVAVVAALRSTAFACSDLELAEHKAAGGTWNYLSRRLEDSRGKVAECLSTLADYHHQRHEGSLAALIERFVAERGQVEVGMLDAGNRNSFRRARFVVEQARAFEVAEPASLRAFVSWMESRAGEAILDNEGAGLDDDEDAVRVLTVHGAKGLEFPIVFVAGLGSAPINRPGTYMADRSTGEIAVCIGSKTTNRSFEIGPAERLSDLEKKHTTAEYARLLYVATTRARDHLIVSLYSGKRASGECGAKLLLGHKAADYAQQLPDRERELKSARRAFEDLEPDPAEELTAAQFTEQRHRMLAAAMQQHYTSATAIGQQKKDEKTDDTEPWSRGRGGTRLGRAVHAAIQSLALDADDAMISAFAGAQAVAEAIPHRAAEVEALVRWVLRSSEATKRARFARRALREVPFAVDVDGTVLEGFIDLVIESDNAIEIVDWKTDQIPAQAIPERMREYEMQAGLYVYGLEAAIGRRASAVTYVFASSQVEVSAGDPATLFGLAQAQLARAEDSST